MPLSDRPFQQAQPVPVRDLFQQLLVVAVGAEGVEQAGQAGGVGDGGGNQGAVEIGAEADAGLAERLDQRVEVADHQLDLGVGAHLPVGAEKASGEVEPDHAVAVADRLELFGREVARARGQGVDVGMGGDQRGGGELGDVPEAALGDVREVDEDALGVTGGDQALAGLGEAGAEIGRVREAERHAVAEDVGAAPDRADRAQARGIEHVEEVELLVDGLGAFDVEHGGDGAARHGGADVGGRAAHGELAVRGGLEPEQQADLMHGHATGEVHRQLGRQRYIRHVAPRGEVGALVGRGAEHREHAAREAAGLGLGQIDMAGAAALEEFGDRIGRGVLHQAEQGVVVAIEDGEESARAWFRWSRVVVGEDQGGGIWARMGWRCPATQGVIPAKAGIQLSRGAGCEMDPSFRWGDSWRGWVIVARPDVPRPAGGGATPPTRFAGPPPHKGEGVPTVVSGACSGDFIGRMDPRGPFRLGAAGKAWQSRRMALLRDLSMSEIVSRIGAVLVYAWLQGLIFAALALALGDRRPQYDGRLTPNPFAQVSVWGTAVGVLFAMSWVRPLRYEPAGNRFGAWGVVLGVLAGLAVMALLVPLADLLRPLALMLPRTGGYAALYSINQFQLVTAGSVLLNLLPIPGSPAAPSGRRCGRDQGKRLPRYESIGLAVVTAAVKKDARYENKVEHGNVTAVTTKK